MVAIERDNPRLKGILPKDYARPALDKNRLGELIDLIGTIGLGDKLIAASFFTFFFVEQQIDAKKQSDWAKVSYVIAKQVAVGKEAETRLADKEARAKFAGRFDEFRESRKRNNTSAFYIRP